VDSCFGETCEAKNYVEKLDTESFSRSRHLREIALQIRVVKM
jgi:hypothetical protein